MLPPTGFPNPPPQHLKLHNVVKPSYERSLDPGTGGMDFSIIPNNYTFTAQFTSTLPLPNPPAHYDDLDEALTHPSFPTSMLEEGIAELATPIDASKSDHESDTLHKENAQLKTQLGDAIRRQREAIAKVLSLEEDRFQREEDDAVKMARKKRRRIRMMEAEESRRKVLMGEARDGGAVDVEMSEGEGEELSSDTDELSSS